MYRLFYLPCIVSFNSPNPPTIPKPFPGASFPSPWSSHPDTQFFLGATTGCPDENSRHNQSIDAIISQFG